MRVEMQRRKDTPPRGFGLNFIDARPPMYFPSSNVDPTQKHPSTPIHNPSGVDMTKPKTPNTPQCPIKLPHHFQTILHKCHHIPKILKQPHYPKIKPKIPPPSIPKHRIPI